MIAPDSNGPLSDLLDRVPVAPAPIDEVLAAGRAASRRRRRTLAALAAGTAVVGAVTAIPLLSDDQAADPSDIVVSDPTETNAPPTLETVLIGVGGAGVEVPATWWDVPERCAEGAWFENAAYYPWPEDCVPSEAEGTSSLTFATSVDAKVTDGLRPAGTVNGHQVVESAGFCDLPSNDCRLTFGIPDLNAYFIIKAAGPDGPDLADQIRESLQPLPPGQAAIPPAVEPTPGLADTQQTLLEAGFDVDVVTDEYGCSENASCVGNFVSEIDPAPGTVVPTGSSVTVTYAVMK